MNLVEITGKTISEAVEEGAKQLGVGISDVEYTVVDEGSKGFLGLGARPAKVKVYLPGFENETPEVTPEPPKAEIQPEKKESVKKEEPKKEELKKEVFVKETPQEAEEETPEQEEHTERPQLTDEDKTVIIGMAEKFLKSVFDTMKINVEFESEFLDNKQLLINMKGDEMGVVIGKRGQTLDSLQTLTSLVVNKSEYPYVNITLDTESYRERRKETLERLAFNLAKKCKHNRKNVVLEPMNPYERRIIHYTLQNDRYVTTYSEGIEPHRYVVITMKNHYNNRQQDKQDRQQQ